MELEANELDRTLPVLGKRSSTQLVSDRRDISEVHPCLPRRAWMLLRTLGNIGHGHDGVRRGGGTAEEKHGLEENNIALKPKTSSSAALPDSITGNSPSIIKVFSSSVLKIKCSFSEPRRRERCFDTKSTDKTSRLMCVGPP